MSEDKYVIKALNSDNYGIWAKKMKLLLSLRGCWQAISDPENASQAQKDKAMSILALNMEDDMLIAFGDSADAASLWASIEHNFRSINVAQQVILKRELNNLHKQPNESLLQYFTRAKELQTKLISAGATVNAADISLQVLLGLPKEYDTVSTVIQASSEMPTGNALYSKLLPFEQRMTHEDNDTHALLTKTTHKGGPARVGGAGAASHKDVVCFYCNKKGHIKADCRKRKADLAKTNGRQVEYFKASSAFFHMQY